MLQIVLYGILDVTAKVVFGWVLILGLGRVSTETAVAAKIGGDVEGGTYSSLNSVIYRNTLLCFIIHSTLMKNGLVSSPGTI